MPIPRAKLQSDAPLPVYYRLQMELKAGIEDGRWGPGEALPPERKLARQFEVSLGTVSRALANLVNEGYLYRIQGKGTFVSGTTIPSESVRYTRLRREFKDSDPKIEISTLGVRKVSGIRPINLYLKTRADQELWELKRIIRVRKRPVHYHISYLPAKRFPALDRIMSEKYKNATLYLTIEKEYGLPTIRNQEIYRAQPADEDVARILEIEPGSPVLNVEMRSFTYKEQPYEYRYSYVLTDEWGLFREV